MASFNVLRGDPIGAIYNSDGFRNAIEDHLEWLRNHKDTKLIEIAPMTALNRKGDLFGLLGDLGIPMYMWWVILRLNHFINPHDYDGSIIRLLVCDVELISRLAMAVSTRTFKTL